MIYSIEQRLPTVGEYQHLRRLAGWPLLEEEAVTEGLSRSLFAVCAMHEQTIIAMARVIGDDILYFHVQDVIVDPSFQRKGVGRGVMLAVMEYIMQKARTGTQIGLMCSKGRERFYESFGFSIRPSEKFGAGMIKIIE